MAKKENIKFEYENGVTKCSIQYDTYTAIGIAKCHPDDKDMQNEKTGCEIAFRRATISLYRYHRDILKAQLKSLNQLYYSMKQSSRFNPNSFENRMLQKQINMIKIDLDTIKEMIVDTQNSIREYINLKDEFYVLIRKNRAKNNK